MRTFHFASSILAAVLGALPVFAAGPGTSGHDLLKSPPGVRAVALAGSYSAFGDDVYVIGYNPAGLTRIAKWSMGLDHVLGLADVQTESFSLAVPTRRLGTVGLQVVYRHMPPIQNELATDPAVRAQDTLVTLAAARRWGRVSVGAAFKTAISQLAEQQAMSNAIDLGLRWTLRICEASLAIQNLGPSSRMGSGMGSKDPLPLTFRLGFSRPILATPQASLLATAEAVHVRDDGFAPSAGLEYWHRTLIALRVGYRGGDTENLGGGVSAGAAIRNALGRLEYEVGYAWHPSKIQSGFTLNNHLFGLLLWY